MSNVAFGPSDPMSMVVLKYLLEWRLTVRMVVPGHEKDGEVEGYVRYLDFAKGSSYAFATVWFEFPRGDDDSESVTVKVTLKIDGTVTFLEVVN